jgi:N-acetyl-anhydromuramyl-L-alanine amidase AmpD
MKLIKTRRKIDWLVVHCTATREGQDIIVEQIRQWHLNRGWSDIGYHYIIDIHGTIYEGRPVTRQGAHVKGFNKNSIGIVYVGGVDRNLAPKDTRTEQQKASLLYLLCELKDLYPNSKVQGHRDFSPDLNNNGIIEPFEFIKACPSFNAKEEYKNI